MGLSQVYRSDKRLSLCLEIVQVALREMPQCGNGDVISGLRSFYDEAAQCLKMAVNDYCQLIQLHDYSTLVNIFLC